MKKFLRTVLIILLCLIFLSALGYIGMARYYDGGFSYGTYINGVYCTGRSVEEVNSDLNKHFPDKSIVINAGDTKMSIALDSIDYHEDYEEALKTYLGNQNPYEWGYNLISDVNHSIEGICLYDADKLKSEVYALGLDRLNASQIVELKLTEEDGYVLTDTKKDVFDPDAVYELVLENLDAGVMEVTLDETCYKIPVYSNYEKNLYKLSGKLDEFTDKKVVFTLKNDKKALNKTELTSLLVMDGDYPLLDENDNLVFDEESVTAGLQEILRPYNSYHNHKFKTHDGRYVYLDKGTYGNQIDIDTECQALFETMSEGEKVYTSIPEYTRTEKYTGEDDIGPTYLEISLDEQHWFYYVDGEMVLESDVVTGNHSRRCDTPEGVDFVYYKQKNRTLVGENYRSFVKYWIAFINHIGVHDASWRKDSEYGGDTYLTNGSHGCVNTPEAKVAELYDLIEVGTPVIVYSYDNSLIKE